MAMDESKEQTLLRDGAFFGAGALFGIGMWAILWFRMENLTAAERETASDATSITIRQTRS